MDYDELKEYISIARKQKVRKLNLSNKEITKLPEDIIRLTTVRSIDLSYNSLTEFPIELTKMPQLKFLLLFRNQIEHIPPEVSQLRNLNLLDISFNNIEGLPPEIGAMMNLQTLDIGYNKLKSLPLEFINLTSLKKLYLEKNPIEFPPAKVIKRGLYATMHYLFGELRKKEASKVMLQVYNLPLSIQNAFIEYINYFNDLIASDEKHEVDFDVKFIKHDFHQDDIDIEPKVNDYLHEFLHFIKLNINDLKTTSKKKLRKEDFNNFQITELKDEIKKMNHTLNEKGKEIQNMQQKLDKFYALLEKQIKS